MKWSKSFQSSSDPQKQRLYRQNAPNHIRDQFISCNLSHTLRSELDSRNFNLRTGDRVEVMRGDRTGAAGIVNRIDRDEEKVYIDGIEIQKVNGTSVQKPFRPSNLQIVALNLDDPSRIEEYGVDELDDVRVSEEEVEEALEEEEEGDMMQQMQTGESSIAPDTSAEDEMEGEDEPDETESEDEEPKKDY
jgi:Ribosomal protein L24